MAAFLQELGMESAHVVGNSSGGWTALGMAKLGHARSVTALSPAGLWRKGTPRQIIWVFRFSHVLARRLGRAVPLLLTTGLGRTLLLGQFFGRPWRMLRWAPSATSPILPVCGLTYRPPPRSVSPAGGTSRPPSPWRGAAGKFCYCRDKHACGRKPPQTRWIKLPGCGYVPTYDDPDLVARVILEGSDATVGE